MDRSIALKVSAVIALAVVLTGYYAGQESEAEDRMSRVASEAHSPYRLIPDVFAIDLEQGWTIDSAPTDGRRYRICGAGGEGSPDNDYVARGAFGTADGRSVEYEEVIKKGLEVTIAGLDPLDGGSLKYAVLTRKLPK